MWLWLKFFSWVILTLAFSNAYAQSRPWTDEELLWGVAAGTTLAIDWGQTHWAAQNNWAGTSNFPKGIHENNLILGKNPSVKQVNQYFLLVTPVLYVLADQYDEYRKPLLIATTMLESIVIINNNVYVGMQFSF